MPLEGAVPVVFVRLFRVWSSAREAGDNPLPHMQQAAERFSPAAELAVACASLFELVEAHLNRSLVRECCCSQALSPDEQALLGLLRHAPSAGIPIAGRAIPHGLPGAIRWAAFAVRGALGLEDSPVAGDGPGPAACPFQAADGAIPAKLVAV